jgi:thiol-disulfide isomerase/thioredoxin
MGKASRTKVESTRREKIAAQRAAERRSEQRRRILLAGGSVVVVLAVVLVFVFVKLNSKPPSAASAQGLTNGPTGSALASVVNKVTSVPVSTLDAVGSGNGAVTGKPTPISGPTLTSNGKPEMFYMGAEYCPYCAAERWAMIVALSRFGTFKNLATVHSAVANGAGDPEPDPDTPTFTFLHATYTSPYLTFTPLEIQTNIPDPATGSYTLLQKPSAAQQAIVTKYGGANSPIPFIDFGNHYLISGVSYNPAVLDGMGANAWATIASDLSNPSSPVAQAVDGTANYITAAICKGLTSNTPASACDSTVKALESQI